MKFTKPPAKAVLSAWAAAVPGTCQASPDFYHSLGGAAGCHALAAAFYARVAKEPILRPLFPSTFTCAIEEFSAFLVQFLGGEAEATQRRWWLSLRESHQRFRLGPQEREAWLRAMQQTLADDSVLADRNIRAELLRFFTRSSAYVVNQGPTPQAKLPVEGELSPLWAEQLALDQAVAAIRAGNADRCIELFEEPLLQARFARSPALHASTLALAATSKASALHAYICSQLRALPHLIRERYKGHRTLLHDACSIGNLALVHLILDLGWEEDADDEETRSPLFCVANECQTPTAAEIVRILVQRSAPRINAPYGVKRCTPLHMAARRGNAAVIEALLDSGADIEARDSQGETPLRRAVNCNKTDAAKLLLMRGADPHSIGSRALTPEKAARSISMKKAFASFTTFAMLK